MSMNEEEQKAIEIEDIEVLEYELNYRPINSSYDKKILGAIFRMLNKVKKQQKEIEQEKEKNKELETENFNIKQQKIIDKNSIPQQENFYDYYNYIHKDKIKGIIEDLNEKIKNATEIEAIFMIKQQQILQKVLEE